MNYELLKQKMDKFFEETSSDYLVSKFENLGYTFIDIDYGGDSSTSFIDINDVNIINVNCEEKPSWYSISNLLGLNNKNKKQNLDKFEVFF